MYLDLQARKIARIQLVAFFLDSKPHGQYVFDRRLLLTLHPLSLQCVSSALQSVPDPKGRLHSHNAFNAVVQLPW